MSTITKEGHRKTQNLTNWFDFTVQQKHLFVKTIYSQNDLFKMKRLRTLEDYYKKFEYFLEVVVLLDKCLNRLTNLTVLEDQETLKDFSMKICPNTMIFLRSMTLSMIFKIVNRYSDYGRKKGNLINKVIGLVYSHIMNFKKLVI